MRGACKKGVLTGTGAHPNYMPARGLLQREGKHRDLPKAHPQTRLAQLKERRNGSGLPSKKSPRTSARACGHWNTQP